MQAEKPDWTCSATAAIKPPTLHTVLLDADPESSNIRKRKAGAARQLHSRAIAGPARRDGSARQAITKQVVDPAHIFVAQFFSNLIGSAPMLTQGRSAARLSTKLSTPAVDDETTGIDVLAAYATN